ncbi:MAG TPA: LPS assembly protein LptD [Stellaceae bacterium]|nr:LPS assembly protein LptD [Stellaceae bacterium]
MPTRGGHRRLTSALWGALCGALAALAALPAAAQFGHERRPQLQKNAPVAFRADEIEYDEAHALTIARGHVEISQGGDVLLADVVTYNQRTDTITASGHVSLLTPGGDIIFTNFMELRDRMNDAFATNVRMLFADRSRLAANAVRRTNGNRTELARAVYSPCDPCARDPTAPPVWQIKARQIDQDQQLKIVEFRDAVMEIGGWPVFYTPYLSAPTASVKRASGFLTPSFGSSHSLGVHFGIPYFWVLGPDKDLTLSPRVTTAAGPVFAGEYRERFGNGFIDAIGSINYSNVGSGPVSDTGDKLRGHINAQGVFDLDPEFRTGFDIQHASDQTYLLRFGFPTPPLNALISRGYLEGFEPRGATDIDAYQFQPLLPGLGDSTQPIVLPVATRSWATEPNAFGFGGIWRFNANLLNIVREIGTQTRRLSFGSQWDRTFRDGIGGQYKFLIRARADGYSIADLSRKSNPDLPAAYFPIGGMPAAEPVGRDFLTGHVFPQVGLVWNYPLIRRGAMTTQLVEPIAAVFAGPSGGNQRRIPDEDSLNFEFSDTDLFRPDRLPGYDVLDTGQRVDYGLKLGLYDDRGGSYRTLIGQSYRAEDNPFMPPGSGAERRLSDVVGRIVLTPSSYLDLIYRFRLDKHDLSNRSQQIGVSAGPQSVRIGGNFLLIPPQQPREAEFLPTTGQSVVFGKREQLSFDATVRLTRYWSLRGTETLNLTNSTNLVNGVVVPQATSTSLYASVSAIYQDECIAFVGSLTQSGIRNGDVTPGVSVLFSVVFKNLGEIGGTLASFQSPLP